MKARTSIAAGVGALGLVGFVAATATLPATVAGATSATSTTHVRHLGTHRQERRGTASAKHAHHEAMAARVHSIALSGALPATYSCANAAADQATISSIESKIDARLAWAQSAEQRAVAAGRSALATWIAQRIAAADQLNTDLSTVSGLITAQCQ